MQSIPEHIHKKWHIHHWRRNKMAVELINAKICRKYTAHNEATEIKCLQWPPYRLGGWLVPEDRLKLDGCIPLLTPAPINLHVLSGLTTSSAIASDVARQFWAEPDRLFRHPFHMNLLASLLLKMDPDSQQNMASSGNGSASHGEWLVT